MPGGLQMAEQSEEIELGTEIEEKFTNPHAQSAINVYVMRHVKQMPSSEIAKLLDMNISTVKRKANFGFELLTISSSAPYILELPESVWRPLYRAGYRSKEQIKEDIINGKIGVEHERFGNRGTIHGIGRAKLHLLKRWCGLDTGDSKRERGERGHRETGREKWWKTGRIPKGYENVRDIPENELNKVLAIRTSMRFKHNQSTVLIILRDRARYSDFNTRDAAKILGVSQHFLRNEVRMGRITRNERSLFSRKEILRWAAYNLNGWAIREKLEREAVDEIEIESADPAEVPVSTKDDENPWGDMVS